MFVIKTSNPFFKDRYLSEPIGNTLQNLIFELEKHPGALTAKKIQEITAKTRAKSVNAKSDAAELRKQLDAIRDGSGKRVDVEIDIEDAHRIQDNLVRQFDAFVDATSAKKSSKGAKDAKGAKSSTGTKKSATGATGTKKRSKGAKKSATGTKKRSTGAKKSAKKKECVK